MAGDEKVREAARLLLLRAADLADQEDYRERSGVIGALGEIERTARSVLPSPDTTWIWPREKRAEKLRAAAARLAQEEGRG